MAKHLLQLLSKHSMREYYINFNVQYGNQLAQGAIALDRLGASQNRIESFINWYRPRLEPKSLHEDGLIGDLRTESEAYGLLGKQTNYYKLLRFYERELEETHKGNLSALVASRFPTLVSGIMGAAMNGVMQTGYGFAAGHEGVTCEGLAWSHYAFMPLAAKEDDLRAPLQHGSLEPFKALRVIRDDSTLPGMSKEGRKVLIGKIASKYGQRVKPLLDQGKTLLDYTYQLRRPILDGSQLTGSNLGRELVNLALKIYITADCRNEFFLCQAVAAAWGLKELMSVMDDGGDVNKCTRSYNALLLATYVGEGCPKIHKEYLADPNHLNITWDSIIQRTLARDYDQRIFKLVQVCYDMWKESPENEKLYKLAALCALDHELASMEPETADDIEKLQASATG